MVNTFVLIVAVGLLLTSHLLCLCILVQRVSLYCEGRLSLPRFAVSCPTQTQRHLGLGGATVVLLTHYSMLQALGVMV